MVDARALARRAAGATPVGRRELLVLAAAMALGLFLRLVYVLATQDHVLAGDEIEYDTQARFIADGKWFWSTTPYGIPHPSLWKPPGYSAWVGIWYSILGKDPDRVLILQTLIGPVTIGLTWLLARRLFNPKVAMLAAVVVAIYPFAWQFEARLYSESLATPLTLLLLLVVLDRTPTSRRAAVAGAILGVSLLVRPSALLLLAGVAVAWWLTAGWRRGTAMVAVTVGVAVLVVAPWTYRNYEEEGGFVPFSVQDAAGYGVFNDEAANDPVYPWAWRPVTVRDKDLFDRRHPMSDTELRSKLRERMLDYIEDNPSSVPKAFFWNGLSRLWDVRRPERALDEVNFEGRSRKLTSVGLLMYYVLLPLALLGLWRARRRWALVLPVVVIALAASVIFTMDAGTRYRATLEPLIVVLACSAAVTLRRRNGSRDRRDYPSSDAVQPREAPYAHS